MFTWNLLFVSYKRLEDTLNQLMVGSDGKDVLVRIHTAIHTAEEAVALAALVKRIIPRAQIWAPVPPRSSAGESWFTTSA